MNILDPLCHIYNEYPIIKDISFITLIIMISITITIELWLKYSIQQKTNQ